MAISQSLIISGKLINPVALVVSLCWLNNNPAFAPAAAPGRSKSPLLRTAAKQMYFCTKRDEIGKLGIDNASRAIGSGRYCANSIILFLS